MRLFRSCLFLALLLVLLGTLGCVGSKGYDGPPLQTVSGKITENGTPPKIFDPMNTVVVAFAKMDGDNRPADVLNQLGIVSGEDGGGGDAAPPGAIPPGGGGAGGGGPAEAEQPRVYEAEVHEDGTYTAQVPKGKYVVVVHIFPMGKFSVTSSVEQADKLKGAFSAQRSPLVKEISGNATFDLEIGAKK